MSKSRNASIASVLNLLTPESVEEHSQCVTSQELPIKLAVGAEELSESGKFLNNSNKAKIIPFKPESKNDVKPPPKEELSEESSSEFLIQERIKSRVSRLKLLEGEAKKLYLAGANLEFCEPENKGDESRAMDPKGVLYNKKHP